MADLGFTIPKLQDIRDRIVADIGTHITGADARLRRSTLNGLALAIAGSIRLVFMFARFIASQLLVDRAETIWLVRHASLWGISRKVGAPAVGEVTLTGADILVGLEGVSLVRADGVRYLFDDASVTLSSGSATANIRCADNGVIGDADAATILSFETVIPRIDLAVTVTAGGLTGGTDPETDEELRARVLERLRNPPQGGAESDYSLWAKQVAGVTRVWPRAQTPQDGRVTVYFSRDNDASIIPDETERQRVLDHLNTVRPVTALVTCPALTPEPVTIAVGLSPNTPTVQAAVIEEVREFFIREAEPGGVIRHSRLQEVISLAAGESYHSLTNPTMDVTASADDHILVPPATITFSSP